MRPNVHTNTKLLGAKLRALKPRKKAPRITDPSGLAI